MTAASAPAAPILFLPRSIILMVVLIFKASAKASPRQFPLQQRSTSNKMEEIRSFEAKALSLGFCRAQIAVEKIEPCGSAVMLQLLGKVLKKRQELIAHWGEQGICGRLFSRIVILLCCSACYYIMENKANRCQ